jgi:hypothetical protein
VQEITGTTPYFQPLHLRAVEEAEVQDRQRVKTEDRVGVVVPLEVQLVVLELQTKVLLVATVLQGAMAVGAVLEGLGQQMERVATE